MPDSSAPSGEGLERGRAVLLGGGGRVAHLDDLVVAHELAGPLDDADADEQQGAAEGEAERDGGGAEAEEGVEVVADLEGEVGDDEEDRADHREAEERGDLALGALLGALVDVGGTPLVGGEAGVGDRLLRARPGVLSCESVMPRPLPWSSCCGCVWAAIQTAKPTRPPMPSDPGEQALGHRAEAAEAEAAVLGGLLETTEVGDDVALLLGGEVAVAEGRHRLRAGQHAPRRCTCGSTPCRVGA